MLQSFAKDLRVSGFAQTTTDSYVRILGKIPFELPGTVRQWKDHVYDRRLTVSVNTTIVEVRAAKAFSKWWSDEYGEPDPLVSLPFPKSTKALPGKVAKSVDIDKLVAAVEKSDSPTKVRDAAIIRLLQFTGCRRGEVAKLTIEDVDFEHDRIVFRDTKGRSDRSCPMHANLRRALRRWLKAREAHRLSELPWLFLGRDGRLLANGVSQGLQRLARDHDVKLTAHAFRRGFAHAWAEAGMPDDSLMSVAGWRSSRMPSMYRAELLHERVPVDFDRVFANDDVVLGTHTIGGRPVKLVKPGPRRTS